MSGLALFRILTGLAVVVGLVLIVRAKAQARRRQTTQSRDDQTGAGS